MVGPVSFSLTALAGKPPAFLLALEGTVFGIVFL